jgi:hypothetical protein
MQLPYGQSPACECRSTIIPSNPSNLFELWSYHGAVAGLESGLDLLRFSTALRGASTQGNLGCSTDPAINDNLMVASSRRRRDEV